MAKVALLMRGATLNIYASRARAVKRKRSCWLLLVITDNIREPFFAHSPHVQDYVFTCAAGRGDAAAAQYTYANTVPSVCTRARACLDKQIHVSCGKFCFKWKWLTRSQFHIERSLWMQISALMSLNVECCCCSKHFVYTKAAETMRELLNA